MATTYTKAIANLHAYKNQDGLDNVCYKATLRFSATDDDTGATAYTEEIFLLESPDPNSFIDFDSLTEETVLSWITIDENHYKEVVDSKLSRRMQSMNIVSKLPWQSEEL